jgi:hypothetical protein
MGQNKDPMGQNFKKLFTAIIIAVCLIPFLGMLIFGESPPGANEITVFHPELLNEDGGVNNEFLSDFSNYMEKRFWLRQELITVNSGLMVSIFGISPVRDVILGKSGWLFYNETTDDFLHKNTLSDNKIDEIAQKLKNIEDYCGQNGKKFVFVIAPNKNSIYPEYMPYLGDRRGERGNAAQLLEKLELYGVTYVNLFETFALYKQSHHNILYHKLDTHWNNLGAAVAADAVISAAGHYDKSFSKVLYDITNDFKGDLYTMLYPTGKRLDENMNFRDAIGTLPYIKNFNIVEGIGETSVTLITENPREIEKVLVFRDSFGNALYPFIAGSYGDAVFLRKTPYLVELAEEYESDTVIIEIAERNLAQFDKFVEGVKK